MGILSLVVVGFLGGAILLFTTASHAKSPSGARAGGGVFAGCALIMALLLLWLWRRRHPRQARYLELIVEPVEARRGQTVSATLQISDAEKLGEKLELGLVCTEYYDAKQTVYTENGSNEQRVTRSVEAFGRWNKADRSQLQQTVRFTIPGDAPFSYEGGAVSWAWSVSAIDRHAHRPDARRELPIWVSP